jgi:hypothetical protein
MEKVTTVGPGTVGVFSSALVDTRTGDIFREGAWKVTVSGPQGKPRTRTFTGETAWSKAEMYAYDALYWLQRWTPANA